MRTTLDTPNDVYHSDDGYISRSTANMAFRYGPQAYGLMLRGVRFFKGSSATVIGSKFDELVERRIMEGLSFDQQLAIPPAEVLTSNGQRRGKAYTDWLHDIEQRGLVPSSVDDYELFMRMEESMMGNAAARSIVESTTQCQRSTWWTTTDGHQLKARFDGEAPWGIWDLKSTSSDWKSLPKKCVDLGYIWQAVWYTMAASEVGIPHGDASEMPFVFVQTVPPFQTKVRTFPKSRCDEARDDMLFTLDWMRYARERSEFEDPDQTVEEMEFPSWV